MGTLGKALGAAGRKLHLRPLVSWWISWSIAPARLFFPPRRLPGCGGAATGMSIRLVQSAEGKELRRRLLSNLAYFVESSSSSLAAPKPGEGGVVILQITAVCLRYLFLF